MQHNGGVFPPWGKVEQWLLTVQHDRDDVERFAANFARLAAAVNWQIGSEDRSGATWCGFS